MAEPNSLSNKTLFVRNIPYSTTDSQLEAAFAQHGDLKSCFTIKEKGVQDHCKGYGYVIFTSSVDAQRAQKLVKVIGKRPVQISFANRKPPPSKPQRRKPESSKGYEVLDDNTRSSEAQESDVQSGNESSDGDDYEKRTSQGVPQQSHKPRSKRSSAKFEVGKVLVLCSLPEGISEKRIRKKCEKNGATVESIIYPVSDRDVPTAFVTFSNHKEARQTLKDLNGVSWKSVTLEAILLSKENKSVSQKTLKKSRLIIRNLSFKCTEEDVRDAFKPFGEVIEVNIPRKPNGHMLGYAFIQFSSYFSAKKAMEELNSREIKGRPVAVDWVVPKQQYEEAVHNQATTLEKEPTKPSMDADRSIELTATDSEGGSDDEDGGSGGSDGDSVMDGSCDESDDDRESWDDGSGSDVDSEGGEGGDGSEGAKVEPHSKVTDRKEDVYDGKTVFIRNVPFMCVESELKDIFEQFGRVRYGRLVLDPDTEMCRGSAFVQFYDTSAVQHCLEIGSSAEGLCCHGRQLDVSLALSKKEVEQLKDHKPGTKVKEDKRNLYLAKEGVILPGSEAAKELTKRDMAKRLKAYSEMKAKLANPNFFVSKTRLSVRNLPTQVDEKKLKAIFFEASGNSPRSVVQVKILRATDRVDSKGIGRSKGFAFVEFSTHETALKALRASNNNPDLFGPRKRLLVEFAVEDSRVMKLREARKLRRLPAKNSTASKEIKRGDTQSEDAKASKTEQNDSTKADNGVATVVAEVGGNTSADRRAKWRQKWQAKRLKRQLGRVSLTAHDTTTSDGHTSSKQLSTSTVATTVSRRTNLELRKRKHKVHIDDKTAFASQKRQKLYVQPENAKTDAGNLLQGATRTTLERDTGRELGSFSSCGRKKQRARKSDKEEDEFAEMIKKYRRKFETSESRWFT